MLFGLTNAPALFQEFVNYMLCKYLDIFVIAYLDNILIYFKDLETYKKYIHTIFKMLKNNKILIKPTKCQ